jgi:hypothetical protein
MAANSSAEETELQALGGRGAVYASILRHVGEFDLEAAQIPRAPAWLNLMPLLRQCKIEKFDGSVTLTEIKALLDAHEPQKGADSMHENRRDAKEYS